ncbi:hypothetical protein PF005_g27798 [Phytophthora fragariae]|uniref:Uncharacterized protein n=1 Tax=Phytophthora fragariae TaxID=53985 RepID=A0A6A3DPB8_9STRA|nr:hypothetical protein PF003_g34900 [Phytophthora fragariae]KAE8921567.1 hypothetical protein PF009_g28157 [Phytophthora fragariae]KAE8969425.1 hypothetical protein PF011_g26811 [Phytophthora fragariae]KAE9081721.1 hypothetical protein PF006_g27056 [Phytophthora fragariae]KAE9115350.1 hypothetical protein PF007_g10052 [Phytophthora fragariae]
MGNAVRHGKHRDSNTHKIMEKMHKGLFASPAEATQQSAKDGKKSHSAANNQKKTKTQQDENAAKTVDSSTKKEEKKKKKKRTSTEPRKGRKQSFTKFMPNYIPTVPIDDSLCGIYDAVEHEDPYGGYYDGKSFKPIDEDLSALCDAVEQEDPRGGMCDSYKPRDALHDGKSFIPIDEALVALCDVIEDQEFDISRQQPQHVKPAAMVSAKIPAKPAEKYIRTQPYKGGRHVTNTNRRYDGTHDNIYYYDNPDTVHHHHHVHLDQQHGDNYMYSDNTGGNNHNGD